MKLYRFDVMKMVDGNKQYANVTIQLWAKGSKEAINRFQEYMDTVPFMLSEVKY